MDDCMVTVYGGKARLKTCVESWVMQNSCFLMSSSRVSLVFAQDTSNHKQSAKQERLLISSKGTAIESRETMAFYPLKAAKSQYITTYTSYTSLT
jgi:hypothetical protein